MLTDIDDTRTTDGAITPDALEALAQLKAAGLHVIPITGRPVGWSEPFARVWPVDAIVAENGAVALIPDDLNKNGLQRPPHERKQLSKIYQQAAATRAANFSRMQCVLAQIEATVPGARRAQDSAGRECDIAIDHSEFTQLPQADIDRCVALMRAAGMNATVSSIHINGSTNDQRMFEHFTHSVGVANIARFVPQLDHLPRYITPSARGAGFAELARCLLAARAGSTRRA